LIWLNIDLLLNLSNIDIFLNDYLLNMDPFVNSSGNFPQNFSGGGYDPGPDSGPNNPGNPSPGNPNPGNPNPGNFHDSESRDLFIRDSESYTKTPGYQPSGDIPPNNRGDLGRLMRFRLRKRLRDTGVDSCSAQMIFAHDNPVNNIAKALLFGHIVDNRDMLTTAYDQLDAINGNRKWSRVKLSLTNPILQSLEP
jgi:hypothetical protein